MKTIEIEVSKRSAVGKGFNRRLRKAGKLPGVLYGAGKDAISLELLAKRANQVILGKNDNAIITFKSADKELNGRHVLIKDWDRDVMTRLPLHADFYEVDLTKEVRVRVALHFVGKAKGIAEGGLVQPVVREIEVDCLPTAIPDFIEVDVSDLGVGESLHIEDIKVPESVKKVFHDNYTLVTCTFIKEEDLTTVVAPVEGAAAAEPEVMAKGKAKEEGAEGAAAAPAKPGDKKAAPAPAKGGDKK